MDRPPILSASGLTRRFGARVALAGVDLEVRRGESVAIFGPNGAGKTTLLRLLSSGLRPHAGTIEFDGRPVTGGDPALRGRFGLLSHQTFLYDDLTAKENLVFYGRLHGVPDPDARAEALLHEVGLARRALDPVRAFSRGMQQRLALARALVHAPELLFLDEPLSGLVPRAAASLRGSLRGYVEAGGTLLLTTHDVDEGLRLCGRWIFLSRGRVASRGTSRPEDAGRLLAAYGEDKTPRNGPP